MQRQMQVLRLAPVRRGSHEMTDHCNANFAQDDLIIMMRASHRPTDHYDANFGDRDEGTKRQRFRIEKMSSSAKEFHEGETGNYM
jgi:hypothetical protein